MGHQIKLITQNDLNYVLDGLSRPECIICTRSAGMFVSHDPVGVMHIAPSGRRSLYGRRETIPGQFTPNGIALRRDGSLLIANAGLEGGVWQVDRSGDCRPFLMEIEGCHLYPANFVLADERGRLWISISTRQRPRSVAYDRSVSDGYIVLCDDAGARIVADGLGYANECRISNDGSHLYVNETFARRISRFAILPDATLGPRETFVELAAGDFPDGGAFDTDGGYWVTNVISNRIYRIEQDGRPRLMFEDADTANVARAEAAFQGGRLPAEILYADAGKGLNHIASISFGGNDLRTAYLGTLKMDKLPSFRAPLPGARPAHWDWGF